MSDADVIKKIIEYGTEYQRLAEEFNIVNTKVQAYPSFKSNNFIAIPNEKKREVILDMWCNSYGKVPNEEEVAKRKKKNASVFLDDKFLKMSRIVTCFLCIGSGYACILKSSRGEFWFLNISLVLLIASVLLESSIIANRMLACVIFKQECYDDEMIILHNNKQLKIKQEVENYNKLVESNNIKIAEKNRIAREEHDRNEDRRLTEYNKKKNAIIQERTNIINKIELVRKNYNKLCYDLGVSPLVFGRGIEAFNEQIWWYAYCLCNDNFASINHKFGKAQDCLRDLSVKLYFQLRNEYKYDQIQSSIRDVRNSICDVKDEIYNQLNNEFQGLNSQLFEIGQRINDNDNKLMRIAMNSEERQ